MRLTLLVLSVILLTSFNPQGKISFWHTNEVRIVETCNGNDVELLILLGTDSWRRVYAHSFALENTDFTIYNDTVEIAASNLVFLVFFPHAGTQSDAIIFSDSGTTKKEVESLGYGMLDQGNYLTFNKADTGRYYVDFSSCNMGNNFWLNVE